LADDLRGSDGDKRPGPQHASAGVDDAEGVAIAAIDGGREGAAGVDVQSLARAARPFDGLVAAGRALGLALGADGAEVLCAAHTNLAEDVVIGVAETGVLDGGGPCGTVCGVGARAGMGGERLFRGVGGDVCALGISGRDGRGRARVGRGVVVQAEEGL